MLDPACGDGRFLAAAAGRIARRFGAVPAGCLHGIDIDPDAVAAARARLGREAEIGSADALTAPLPPESFDVVVGNPPFLNQLADATRRRGRSPLGRRSVRRHRRPVPGAGDASGPADGGRVGLVLPQSLLATA